MRKTLLTLLFGLIATIGYTQNVKTIALSQQFMKSADKGIADLMITVNTGILEIDGKMMLITEILNSDGQTMYRITYDVNHAYSSGYTPAIPTLGLEDEVDFVEVFGPGEESSTLSFMYVTHLDLSNAFELYVTLQDGSQMIFELADKNAVSKTIIDELRTIFEYAAKNGLVSKKTF